MTVPSNSEYIFRLTPAEFGFVFRCVVGDSNEARRRADDNVREAAEDKLIQAMLVGDTGNGGTVRCDELPMLNPKDDDDA